MLTVSLREERLINRYAHAPVWASQFALKRHPARGTRLLVLVTSLNNGGIRFVRHV
jgi:hypothetical protein